MKIKKNDKRVHFFNNNDNYYDAIPTIIFYDANSDISDSDADSNNYIISLHNKYLIKKYFSKKKIYNSYKNINLINKNNTNLINNLLLKFNLYLSCISCCKNLWSFCKI
jgi:hypothetical protein